MYQCTLTPADTDDVMRHLFYALYVARDGLAAAGKPLIQLEPRLGFVSWSHAAYNYPIVAIAFFVVAAKCSATSFNSKLLLTLIEAFNALLIKQLTGDTRLAWLYWVSPLSIWRVSREANFEPLQTLFIVSALLALTSRPWLSGCLLACAIQTKLTAAFLLPWFFVTLAHRGQRDLAAAMLAMAAGFAVSVYAQLQYPMFESVVWSVRSLRFNPYYWNVLDRSLFTWTPPLVSLLNALASYSFLGVCLTGLIRRKSAHYLGAAAFMLWCKTGSLIQPWYMLTAPALALTIPDGRIRLWLFVIALNLDPLSPAQLILGPRGMTIGDAFAQVTAFTPFRLP